jgi:hypothetical protein
MAQEYIKFKTDRRYESSFTALSNAAPVIYFSDALRKHI